MAEQKAKALDLYVDNPKPERGVMGDYLTGAIKVLDKFGIDIGRTEESRLAVILEQIKDVEEAKVVAIARTVRYMGAFNELARDKIGEMRIDDRYLKVQALFDSVSKDLKKLIGNLEDEKVSFGEKLGYYWMRLARGTPHKRFEKIRKTYLAVTDDTRSQLMTEAEIIRGYVDFRKAVKQSEILSYEVLKTQEGRLAESKKSLEEAVKAVTEFKGEDDAERGRLEFARDEARQNFDLEDKKYQLIKNVAEDTREGYSVGDGVSLRLGQSHGVKEQVYIRAQSFFATNESVFTLLDATYTSLFGLAEASRTLEAMAQGTNRALEDAATVGTKVLTEGVKAAYGKKLDAKSVKMLIDSIESFQVESVKLIEQSRRENTENTNEIARIVEESKTRIANTITGYQAPVEQKALPAAQ